jgi:hypothetical protein
VAAFSITSNTNQTVSNIQDLFNFLTDFRNFSSILPEDKIENFEFSDSQCSFNIKGITPMTIKLVEKTPYSSILFSSEALTKYKFNLKVEFTGNAAETGQCTVNLSGELNPFIKAMAEKPLTGLVNTMSLKLSQLQL